MATNHVTIRTSSDLHVALVHSAYRGAQPSGENVAVRAQAAALRNAGVRVSVIEIATDEVADGAFYKLRSAGRVATGKGRSPLKAISKLRPDILHVHNTFPNLGRSWVQEVAAPVACTVHNFRPICANGLLLREGQACTKCPDGHRWAGVRHGCYRGSRLATAPIAWYNRHGPEGDDLFRRADVIVMVSELQKQLFERAGLPTRSVTVSPNFVAEDVASPHTDDAVDRQGWLFVGRLSEEKGVLQLLRHWPAGEELTVVGDGPLRSQVEALARARGVNYIGALDRREVLGQMRSKNGLVVPSLCFEAAPLVYAEALASGTPVVAFDPSAVAAAIEAEHTGAVAAWDESGIATALRTVAERRGQLAERCRSVFEERYSEQSYLSRTLTMYHSLLR